MRAHSTPIIDTMGPELIKADLAASRIDHRHPGLVNMDPALTVDERQLPVVKSLEPPGCTLDPAHRRRAVEREAVTCQHLGLPVDRQIPGKALADDPRDERRGCHSALDHAPRRAGLDNPSVTRAAGIFGPNSGNDAQDSRHDIDRLADILADPVQAGIATGTLQAVWLDHFCHTRQMLGQRTDIALRPRPRARRRRIIIGRNRGGRDLAQIPQVKPALVAEDCPCLFRTRAKEHGLVSRHELVGSRELSLQFGDLHRHRRERFGQVFRAAFHRHSLA